MIGGMFFWIAIFIISLAVLIKASDYFTESAEKIGIFFGMPAFLVGVTIVALGTSLPELISSIFAVISDSSEIVIGNVVGSNIANILLILGISSIAAKKLKIHFELIHVDLPILVGSAFLLALMIWDGKFTALEGVLTLILFIVYIFYTIRSEEKNPDEEIHKEITVKDKKKLKLSTIFILIASALFVFLGAKYTIDSVIHLSELLNIGKEIIAISAIALGTSLPELSVSVSAARKGKPEIAVGNILGSNIFNALLVTAVPSFIGTLTVTASILTFSLPVLLMVTLLYFFITQDKEITRWEGMMLIVFYVFFIGRLFSLI